jgi:DNA end-binding protein Ku
LTRRTFAGPDGAVSEKPYALLREVMKQTGKIAVGKVVLRDREDLVAVFPHEDGLVLQKLHYPHELRKMGRRSRRRETCRSWMQTS